jgi:S-adenosylmethionine decarboxylase proenzyme
MEALARHVVAEYYGCDPAVLDDPARLQPLLEAAVAAAKATVITTHLHQFAPQGVSGVVILAESHLAVHTWPEYGYAAVEIFTCGDHTDPQAGHQYLLDKLRPAFHTVRVLERGDLGLIKRYPAEMGKTAIA